MNLKRKILRMVDLRVHHYWNVERHETAVHHVSAHGNGVLKSDSADYKAFASADKRTEVAL